MPIHAARGVEAGVGTVKASLSELLSEFGRAGLSLAGVDGLELAAPHRVFTLTLRDLAEGRGIEAARLTSIRYLVLQSGRVVASAEISADETGAPARFNHLNQGPFVQETADLLAVAESLPEVQTAGFELRGLRMPDLHMMALWLKSEDGNGDLCIPMAPAPDGIDARRPTAPEDLLGALRELAGGMLDSATAPGAEQRGG